VKIAFLFFLLITHWCGAPASWAARHTTVCLDNNNNNNNNNNNLINIQFLPVPLELTNYQHQADIEVFLCGLHKCYYLYIVPLEYLSLISTLLLSYNV